MLPSPDDAVAMIRMNDVRPSAVARLLESEARECVPERVAICHLTVGPAEPDYLRAELDECAEPLLALAQGLIGQVTFDDECGGMGDVRGHLEIVGRRAPRLAVVVAEGPEQPSVRSP